MFQALRGFANRHKRKILVATGFAASLYFAADYIKSKFFELQDRLATERAAKENLRRRFEQNQQDATFTIMALLPGLSNQILEKYPVEKITQELQAKRLDRSVRSGMSDTGASEVSITTSEGEQAQGSSNNNVAVDSSVHSVQSSSSTTKSKTQLWQELKIQSITRLFTMVYSMSLLVFFTRLQLNILGRKNYVASVIHLARHKNSDGGDPIELIDQDSLSPQNLAALVAEEQEMLTNRMYLTFSWWLLNKGWDSLSVRINTAVNEVFGTINPRSDLSLDQLVDLYGQIQYSIDKPFEPSSFLAYLLPPAELESYVLTQAPISPPNSTIAGRESDTTITTELRGLLDETADFIESPNAQQVLRSLVHTGLSVVVDKIATIYPQIEIIPSSLTPSELSDATSQPSTMADTSAKVKLASILANITRQAQAMTTGAPYDPNEYIQAMTQLPELDGFSAVIYSNFDWKSFVD